MRPTTKPKTLLVAILFASAAAHALDCPKPDTQDLVGLWETRDASKGGIGHTVEFRPDGSYVEATTVLVNGAYRVSGDRLIVGETANALRGEGSSFEVQGDKLIQTSPDGEKLNKERLGKAEEGGPPIVGAWRYRHYTGATAFERYTPDGRLLFRLPMTSSKGCYKVQGGQLVYSRQGQKEITVSFETRPGELVLHQPGKPTTAYGLAEAGPWYDREHIQMEKN